jgi:hypothetical protein
MTNIESRFPAKCIREALEIVHDAPSERFAKELFARFEEEARGITQLSTASFKELLKSMLEDKTTWGTLSGFVGASLGGFPPAVCNGQLKQDTFLSSLLVKFPLKFQRGLVA